MRCELDVVFLDFDQRLVAPLVKSLNRLGYLCSEVRLPEPGSPSPDLIFYGQVSDLRAIARARQRFPYACIIVLGQIRLGGEILTQLAKLSVRWLDQGSSVTQIASTVHCCLSGLGLENQLSGFDPRPVSPEQSLLHLAKRVDGHGNGKNVFLVRRLNAAIESGFYWLSARAGFNRWVSGGIFGEAAEVPNRFSICVSSGAGCALQASGMACRHCYTGLCQFRGNLTAEEIAGQFILTHEDAPLRSRYMNHLSMMGQGDCLLNLSAVLSAWRELTERYRRLPISFSTVGFLDSIRQLLEEDLSSLAFSSIQITMPYGDDARRQLLLPAATGDNSAEKTVPALLSFAKSRKRPLVYNVSMIGGPEPWRNNRPSDARQLAAFCRRFDPSLENTVVKVTDYNGDSKGLSVKFESGTKHRFVDTLTSEGVPVRAEHTLGATKNAGCGELLCRILPAVSAQ